MNKINYLQDSLLTNLPAISHGFFTRRGGVSEGVFASLNVSLSTGDNPEHVQENRKRLLEAMSFPPANLVLNKQVHSAKAIFVDKAPAQDEMAEADGLVTTVPGLLLGVMGADCPPVLFADPEAKVIAAAHAGWKGAKTGVLEATIDLMIEHGAKLDRIRAVVGPSIAQRSYEVDQSFYDQFVADTAENSAFFMPSVKPGHHMFDIKGFCMKRLQGKGVQHVSVMPNDTYTEPVNFYSNRRRFHMGEEKFGVCVHVIGIDCSSGPRGT